jgi:putative transposase
MRTLCFEGNFNRRMSWYKEFCHERAEGVLDQFLKRFCDQWLQDEYELQSGAARYERSDQRQDRRNGHYERSLITRRGRIKVKVPRGEAHKYYYSLFKKYERRTREFDDVVVDALLLGHSGRKAEQFFKKLLGDGTVSHATAAKTLRRFDSQVVEWRQRELRDNAVILVVDAVYFRGVAHCSKSAKPVLFALAVYADGSEEVVGFQLANSESQIAWYRFFADLYERGLKNVQLIVRDDHSALRSSAVYFWPKSLDQLCVFHLIQNVGKHLRGDHNKKAIIAGLQEVYRSQAEAVFWSRLKVFLKRWQRYRGHAAIEYVVRNADLSIKYFNLEPRFWTIGRTTNRLERLFEELNRRVRPFRRFPNALSCERWLFALLKQNGRITSALLSQQDS